MNAQIQTLEQDRLKNQLDYVVTIIDNKFGSEYSKKNPSLVIKLMEIANSFPIIFKEAK